MATLVLRQSKGSPLTNNEVDSNFTNLNTDIQTRLLITDFTANNILTYLKTVTTPTSNSGLNADTVTGLGVNSALPAGPNYSSLVSRDSSGNSTFNNVTSLGTITGVNGSFSGTLSVASINISGGSIPIAAGGTGATTAINARSNLGLAIGTNVQAWNAKLDALATPTYAADTMPYFTGASAAASTSLTATGRSIIGSTNASAAQAVIGVRVGTDVQPFSGELSAYSGLSTTGLVVRTATNTITSRSIVAGADITISNGDGVSGNPTIAVGNNIPRLSTSNTFANDITVGGTIYASGFQVSSDERLKENIQTLNNAVDTVSQLRGVSYLRNGKPEIGLIAQEVERIMPFLVGEDEKGFKSVAYANIVGLLVEAIKEQNETIKELNTRLEKLEN